MTDTEALPKDQHASADRPKGPRSGRPKTAMPVVAIGASAGGLEALTVLFSHVPERSGLAWVVVVHSPPHRGSHLASLLQRHARLPVQQVTGTTALAPDHVYVVPPGADLDSVDGHLRLPSPATGSRSPAPVDQLFRTLAGSYHGHAIGVLLSGTGSDGTLGIRHIAEQGGLCVVQDPGTARFSGMPESALATGLVNLVLEIERIPGALIRYANARPRLRRPNPQGDGRRDRQSLVQHLLAQLRTHTGRDFGHYRRGTLLRQVARRMRLLSIEELPRYLAALRQDPQEARRLADELLTTVTTFFGDPAVFEYLRRVTIPALFDARRGDAPIRVWSVGCATGEEAYSIAMLLLEEAARRDLPRPHLQLFASDIHEPSLKKARAGFYPGGMDGQLTPDRLNRYFTPEHGGYRVRTELREQLVFATHDPLSDPPFSRIDLLLCRSLLIRLRPDVQRHLQHIFHYALNAGACLVLGRRAHAVAELFQTVDTEHSVHRRRDAPPGLQLPVLTRAPRHRGDGEPGAASEPPDDARMHLRATLEQLEASSEELQSVNEELRSLNQDNRHKVEELSLLSSDLQNLLAATDFATLFLDRELRILRFTPKVTELFGVRITDRGRPLTELTSRLDYPELADDAHRVLRDLTPVQREVNDESGHWYLTRLRPYRDAAERIGGVVITLVDITARKEGELALQALTGELQAALADAERLQSVSTRMIRGGRADALYQDVLEAATAIMGADMGSLQVLADGRVKLLATHGLNAAVAASWNDIDPAGGSSCAQVLGSGRRLQLADVEHSALIGGAELDTLRQAGVRAMVSIPLVTRHNQVVGVMSSHWRQTCQPAERNLRLYDVVARQAADLIERAQAEQALQQLNEKLEARVNERTDQVRRLARSLTAAEQRERERISLVLHDNLQQLLHGVALKLKLLRKDLGSSQTALAAQLDDTQGWLDQGLETLADLTVELSPPILEEEGLLDALEWLGDQMHRLHGLQVEVKLDETLRVLERDVTLLLFRVVRELLFNVARHAGTDRAEVHVRNGASSVEVRVVDRGRGFDASAISRADAAHFGLYRARERLALLGGELDIDSTPGAGTCVTVRAPATFG